MVATLSKILGDLSTKITEYEVRGGEPIVGGVVADCADRLLESMSREPSFIRMHAIGFLEMLDDLEKRGSGNWSEGRSLLDFALHSPENSQIYLEAKCVVADLARRPEWRSYN